MLTGRSCLKPGGWVEFQDWDSKMLSADGTLDGTTMNEYFERIIPAFSKAGYDIRHGRNIEGWVKEAGFINVAVKKHLVPLGTWPKDKKQVRTYWHMPCLSRKQLTMLNIRKKSEP